jgi:hypothetical protein
MSFDARTDQPVLTCEPGSIFIASIYSCVTQWDTLDPEFGKALLQSKTCPGGVFTTAGSLQRLRMCDVISGSLILENISDAIDTTVFWDIRTIKGTRLRSCIVTAFHAIHWMGCRWLCHAQLQLGYLD